MTVQVGEKVKVPGQSSKKRIPSANLDLPRHGALDMSLKCDRSDYYLLLCAMAGKVNAWLCSFWKDIECPVPQSFPDVQGGG